MTGAERGIVCKPIMWIVPRNKACNEFSVWAHRRWVVSGSRSHAPPRGRDQGAEQKGALVCYKGAARSEC